MSNRKLITLQNVYLEMQFRNYNQLLLNGDLRQAVKSAKNAQEFVASDTLAKVRLKLEKELEYLDAFLFAYSDSCVLRRDLHFSKYDSLIALQAPVNIKQYVRSNINEGRERFVLDMRKILDVKDGKAVNQFNEVIKHINSSKSLNECQVQMAKLEIKSLLKGITTADYEQVDIAERFQFINNLLLYNDSTALVNDYLSSAKSMVAEFYSGDRHFIDNTYETYYEKYCAIKGLGIKSPEFDQLLDSIATKNKTNVSYEVVFSSEFAAMLQDLLELKSSAFATNIDSAMSRISFVIEKDDTSIECVSSNTQIESRYLAGKKSVENENFKAVQAKIMLLEELRATYNDRAQYWESEYSKASNMVASTTASSFTKG